MYDIGPAADRRIDAGPAKIFMEDDENGQMKIRIKFEKYAEMRFIGHLDLLRFFQKAIRRAGIDIRFTEGMSPHMVMSFASPLGVGLLSRGEYIDIEVNTPISTGDAVTCLNSVMPEGLCILDFRQVEEGKAGKAMSLVAAADYEIRFRKGHEPAAGWEARFAQFMERSSIEVLKETKKSSKLTDIRPMIYEWKTGDNIVFLRVASGSSANLKPDIVMRAFLDWCGEKSDPFAFEITRIDLYADRGTDGEHRFVSLNELGQTVPESVFTEVGAETATESTCPENAEQVTADA